MLYTLKWLLKSMYLVQHYIGLRADEWKNIYIVCKRIYTASFNFEHKFRLICTVLFQQCSPAFVYDARLTFSITKGLIHVYILT